MNSLFQARWAEGGDDCSSSKWYGEIDPALQRASDLSRFLGEAIVLEIQPGKQPKIIRSWLFKSGDKRGFSEKVKPFEAKLPEKIERPLDLEGRSDRELQEIVNQATAILKKRKGDQEPETKQIETKPMIDYQKFGFRMKGDPRKLLEWWAFRLGEEIRMTHLTQAVTGSGKKQNRTRTMIAINAIGRAIERKGLSYEIIQRQKVFGNDREAVFVFRATQ